MAGVRLLTSWAGPPTIKPRPGALALQSYEKSLKISNKSFNLIEIAANSLKFLKKFRAIFRRFATIFAIFFRDFCGELNRVVDGW